MALTGSYEAKLLRLLVGFIHVSTLHQISLTRHGKPLHLLTEVERNELEAEVLSSVMRVAHQVSEEALLGNLKMPTVN
jgi:uncharacterized protein (DUF952 family)